MLSDNNAMIYVESLGTYVNKERTLIYNYANQQWEPLSEEQHNLLMQQSVSDQQMNLYSKKKNRIKINLYDEEHLKRRNMEKNKRFNASIFVSGLPETATEKDLEQYFSKCGVIQTREVSPGVEEPRIKIYRDAETGKPTGSALITYVRSESINLAITILDDTEFMGKKISVQEAEFSSSSEQKLSSDNKRLREDVETLSNTASITGTESTTAPTRKKQKKTAKPSKSLKKLQWGFDDEKDTEDKNYILILKHMFHPNDALNDPNFFVELKKEISDELNRSAPVERVKIFKNSKEGVVQIRFKRTATIAGQFQRIIAKFNGRYFAGRQITAMEGTGQEYWETIEEDNEEERHEAFGALLDQL